MPNAPTLDPIGLALFGFSVAGAMLATADIALALADGPEIPLRINLIIVATVATTICVLTTLKVHRRQLADLEGITALQARTERSLETLRSALVQQSARLVEVTGEIPRFPAPVRGVATVTPAVEPAPDVPRQAAGLDPTVMDAAHRISRRITGDN